MHTHDEYAPHSHEVRADHLGVPKIGDPDYAAWMAKQSRQTREQWNPQHGEARVAARQS